MIVGAEDLNRVAKTATFCRFAVTFRFDVLGLEKKLPLAEKIQHKPGRVRFE